MDGARFDRFARAVANTGSRRALLRWAAGGLAGGALAARLRAAGVAAQDDSCPPGSFIDEDGDCTLCPEGRFSAEADVRQCTPCPRGSFAANPGSVQCTACQAGTFADNLGSIQCTACAAGTSSGAGSASCSTCAAGTSAGAGSATCAACEPGTFAANEGSASCTDCQPGTFADDERSTACTLCPAGTFAADEGSVACAACPSGTTSAPGSTSCVPVSDCPKGRTLFCPGTNGHKGKCCPRDTVCNNSPSGAVNCRKP